LIKKKRELCIGVCLFLILSFPAYAVDKTSNTNGFDNPYVSQYFLEKSNNLKQTDLVDPAIEDQIAIDALVTDPGNKRELIGFL